MDRSIKLRIKIDINSKENLQILSLKGALICKKYTEIIHMADETENYSLHTFTVQPEAKPEIIAFINNYIIDEGIEDIISVIKV
jgi:hypothetical protein|nr:hypothetical protein [uncultured Flavobacterium sp.]